MARKKKTECTVFRGLAYPFDQVQKEVAELIKERIVIGHSLENDFRVLLLSHPFKMVRDTAKYRRFQRSRGKPRKLKALAQRYLGMRIQSGEHDPVRNLVTNLSQ